MLLIKIRDGTQQFALFFYETEVGRYQVCFVVGHHPSSNKGYKQTWVESHSPLDTTLPPSAYYISHPASIKLKQTPPTNSSARIFLFLMVSNNKLWVCGYVSQRPIVDRLKYGLLVVSLLSRSNPTIRGSHDTPVDAKLAEPAPTAPHQRRQTEKKKRTAEYARLFTRLTWLKWATHAMSAHSNKTLNSINTQARQDSSDFAGYHANPKSSPAKFALQPRA